jgi:hypothetical protein
VINKVECVVIGQRNCAAVLAYLVADYSMDDGCPWE